MKRDKKRYLLVCLMLAGIAGLLFALGAPDFSHKHQERDLVAIPSPPSPTEVHVDFVATYLEYVYPDYLLTSPETSIPTYFLIIRVDGVDDIALRYITFGEEIGVHEHQLALLEYLELIEQTMPHLEQIFEGYELVYRIDDAFLGSSGELIDRLEESEAVISDFDNINWPGKTTSEEVELLYLDLFTRGHLLSSPLAEGGAGLMGDPPIWCTEPQHLWIPTIEDPLLPPPYDELSNMLQGLCIRDFNSSNICSQTGLKICMGGHGVHNCVRIRMECLEDWMGAICDFYLSIPVIGNVRCYYFKNPYVEDQFVFKCVPGTIKLYVDEHGNISSSADMASAVPLPYALPSQSCEMMSTCIESGLGSLDSIWFPFCQSTENDFEVDSVSGNDTDIEEEEGCEASEPQCTPCPPDDDEECSDECPSDKECSSECQCVDRCEEENQEWQEECEQCCHTAKDCILDGDSEEYECRCPDDHVFNEETEECEEEEDNDDCAYPGGPCDDE